MRFGEGLFGQSPFSELSQYETRTRFSWQPRTRRVGPTTVALSPIQPDAAPFSFIRPLVPGPPPPLPPLRPGTQTDRPPVPTGARNCYYCNGQYVMLTPQEGIAKNCIEVGSRCPEPRRPDTPTPGTGVPIAGEASFPPVPVRRRFFTDESGVIRYEGGRSPPSEDPAVGVMPSPFGWASQAVPISAETSAYTPSAMPSTTTLSGRAFLPQVPLRRTRLF